MSATFELPVRIRFAHCDPAGIVYFPQYLVMTNALVEDWFTERLAIDYAHMIETRRVGLPIVKRVVEIHQGRISLHPGLGGSGLGVLVELPSAQLA